MQQIDVQMKKLMLKKETLKEQEEQLDQLFEHKKKEKQSLKKEEAGRKAREEAERKAKIAAERKAEKEAERKA